MLQFLKVEDSIYRLNLKRNSDLLSNDYTMISQFEHITECCDPTCIYTRYKTTVREKFEEKIVKSCEHKTNLKFLFYGSFLLYQELKLILLLADQLSEIHFTDYAYEDLASKDDDNRYILALSEFMSFIHKEKINVRVYVHTNPDKITQSTILRRRFDIICGIDIDYTNGETNNRPIMKKIAEHTLKINGKMLMSQHFIDQVDLCCYEISSKGFVQLIKTEDYVKPSYYNKYWYQNILCKLDFANSLVGLLCMIMVTKNTPIISIAGGTYCAIDLVNKYLLENKPNYFKREIKNFSCIIKR